MKEQAFFSTLPDPSTMPLQCAECLLEAGKTEASPSLLSLSFASPSAFARHPPTSSSHLKGPLPQGGAAETAPASRMTL